MHHAIMGQSSAPASSSSHIIMLTHLHLHPPAHPPRCSSALAIDGTSMAHCLVACYYGEQSRKLEGSSRLVGTYLYIWRHQGLSPFHVYPVISFVIFHLVWDSSNDSIFLRTSLFLQIINDVLTHLQPTS